MAKPKGARRFLLDWTKAKLLAINGGDNWNHDLASKGIVAKPKAIELIGVDETPWVWVTAGNSRLETKVGGCYEPSIDMAIFLLMKEDETRYGQKTADELAEELLDDVIKALTGGAKEPETQATLRFGDVTPDVDEEMGRWSLKRLDCQWVQTGAIRGT